MIVTQTNNKTNKQTNKKSKTQTTDTDYAISKRVYV